MDAPPKQGHESNEAFCSSDSSGESTFQDYSHETKLAGSRLLRWGLLSVGTLSLVLGVIGIFLPVLPTTPFLLLTAGCYARGSKRFYNVLMNNRFLGPYIRAWRNERRIPKRAKILAVTTIVITIGTSAFFFIPVFAVKILVCVIGLTVIAYILRFPS